jgi:hypothetical protein
MQSDLQVLYLELAKGRTIYDAVKKTKKFISLSIKYTPEIGQGRSTTCTMGMLRIITRFFKRIDLIFSK